MRSCPLCDAPSEKHLFIGSYEILRCSACRHQFADLPPRSEHVTDVYADTYFTGGGAGYSNYHGEANILLRQGERYGEILKRHAQHCGELLDVGAAAGYLLQGLCRAGWQGRGIEPNETMARFARETLRLAVQTGTFEHYRGASELDAITMIQVISHFIEPQRALGRCAELLKTRGLLLIETWNRESWACTLLGKRWHEYSPPSVLHWYSPSSLVSCARKFGFREVARGRPQKWLNVGHAASLLRYKLQGTALGAIAHVALAPFPKKLALPYPGDDLFWILLQLEK